MSMTKQDFIALADAIAEHNRIARNTGVTDTFNAYHLETLADFCRSQNSNFMRERWLGYIAGENGKNGGSIRK